MLCIYISVSKTSTRSQENTFVGPAVLCTANISKCLLYYKYIWLCVYAENHVKELLIHVVITDDNQFR